MEKEDIKAYMLSNIKEETVFKECIKNELLILIFSAPVIVLGMNNILLIILGVLPSVVYLITVLSLHEEGAVKGVSNILHDGIFMLCFSYLFSMLSLEIVFSFFEKDEKGLVIGVMVLGYIVVILLYGYMIRKNIEKGIYAGEKEKAKRTSYYAIFAILGMITAKVFFKNMDQISAAKVVGILSLFLSYLCLMGILSIFQYIYLVRHRELLEGFDKDTKE